MEVKRSQIERALAAPGDACRLFLLFGPDEAGSRALAAMLGKAMGDAAERVDLAPAQLKADPALLADEAAAVSLFGGPRWIRVEGAGEEILLAVDALLGASAAGNPVVIVAGNLRKDSALRKRAAADPAALAFASYAPEGQELDRIAANLAREAGVQLDPEGARALAAVAGGDRALLAQEIEKLALFLDAAPDRPREASSDSIAAIGAGEAEADIGRLVDAVLGGAPHHARREIGRLAAEGRDGIALLRVLIPRLHQLAALRADVDSGNSVEAALAKAGKAIFWKDRDRIGTQVARWSSERLAAALGHIGEAERQLKAPGAPGPVIAEAALLSIARAAAARR